MPGSKTFSRYFLAGILLLFAGIIQAQCLDPFAANFDPSVNSDKECRYAKTIQNPPFLYLLDNEIEENSGLEWYNGLLWTHNDSGGEALLYGLNPETGEIVQRIEIENVKNRDWEDITLDDTYFYIGDFGNNAANRKDLAVFRFPLSAIPASGDVKVRAEKIFFHFPDQTVFLINWDSNNFDCESMVAGKDRLYLFSKNRGDQQSKLYSIPKEPGTYTAEYIDSFNSRGLLTGASFNSETNLLALVGYTYRSWHPFIWLFYDFEGEDFFSGNSRRFDLPNHTTVQTEGIVFVSPYQLMISAESTKTFSARMFEFDIRPFADKHQLAINQSKEADWLQKTTDTATYLIDINKLKADDYLCVFFDKEDRELQQIAVQFDKDSDRLEVPVEIIDQLHSVALFGKRNTYYTTLHDE